jgi:hypothetical protein
MIERPTTDELMSTGNVPRVHGNGFLQLDIAPGVRLHIWGHSALPRQRINTAIHNHRFDFESTIIAGRLVNVEYVVNFHDPEFTHEMYTPQARDGEDTILVPVCDGGIGVSLETPNVRLLNVGDRYTMQAARFHETFSDQPSATIMRKTGITKVEPTVLVPKGVKPDNAFNRNTALGVKDMWGIIEDVLWP